MVRGLPRGSEAMGRVSGPAINSDVRLAIDTEMVSDGQEVLFKCTANEVVLWTFIVSRSEAVEYAKSITKMCEESTHGPSS